jgi:hypothetical protein
VENCQLGHKAATGDGTAKRSTRLPLVSNCLRCTKATAGEQLPVGPPSGAHRCTTAAGHTPAVCGRATVQLVRTPPTTNAHIRSTLVNTLNQQTATLPSRWQSPQSYTQQAVLSATFSLNVRDMSPLLTRAQDEFTRPHTIQLCPAHERLNTRP